MRDGDILFVKGSEVSSLLEGRDDEIISRVRMAYEAHARGKTSVPHSTFLRFPDSPQDRIIALPAYLGGESEVAGIKWVSSFPGNLSAGLDRASAVVILNSAKTGRPRAILEGSVISMKRTAASAALAAQLLYRQAETPRLGLIGCGLINSEIARFVVGLWPELREIVVYDVDPLRAGKFKQKCREQLAGVEIEIVGDAESVLARSSLISIATTALAPYITDLSQCSPGSTILHISLRDLAPEVILSCDNIVDDPDHVCRAQTSVHLTEQQLGNRDFIRCTLAEIALGTAAPRKDSETIAVFSPFGLGILDLAVSQLVYDLALEADRGMVIESFLPVPWDQQPDRKGAASSE